MTLDDFFNLPLKKVNAGLSYDHHISMARLKCFCQYEYLDNGNFFTKSSSKLFDLGKVHSYELLFGILINEQLNLY